MSKPTKKSAPKTFNLKITKGGLQTIVQALECYSRLGINQFTYCLDAHPKFAALSWDRKKHIEDFLKFCIDDNNLGIGHPEVVKFNEAYQIKKEIEKNIVISEKPVMDGYSVSYSGALGDYDYLPKFFDDAGNRVVHEIEYPLSPKQKEVLMDLRTKGLFTEMWAYIDKTVNFGGVKGNSSRISEDLSKVIVNSPYRTHGK